MRTNPKSMADSYVPLRWVGDAQVDTLMFCDLTLRKVAVNHIDLDLACAEIYTATR
jgi:hypothetical protein